MLLDGNVVEPGAVVFGRRTQTLSATLEGAIAACLSLVTNADGSVSIVVDPLIPHSALRTPHSDQSLLTSAATENLVAAEVTRLSLLTPARDSAPTYAGNYAANERSAFAKSGGAWPVRQLHGLGRRLS